MTSQLNHVNKNVLRPQQHNKGNDYPQGAQTLLDAAWKAVEALPERHTKAEDADAVFAPLVQAEILVTGKIETAPDKAWPPRTELIKAVEARYSIRRRHKQAAKKRWSVLSGVISGEQAQTLSADASDTASSDHTNTIAFLNAVEEPAQRLDKVKLTDVQREIRNRLSDKDLKAIGAAKPMSEIGARAWLSEHSKVQIAPTVEIAQILAGMEKSKVDEGPLLKFMGAINSKWLELKPKWIRDLRAVCAAELKNAAQSGQNSKRDTNIVGQDHFSDLVQFGMKNLTDGNRLKPTLFKTGSELSWIETNNEEDIVAIQILTEKQFRAGLHAFATYYAPKGEVDVIGIYPPIDVTQYIYSMPSSSLDLPYLHSVTRIPTIAPTGKIIQSAGYNSKAKVFYSPPKGLDIPYVSPQPAKAEVKAAKALLIDIFADFPFDGQTRAQNLANPPASMVNAIALLLQPFLRPMYNAATPATLITKPDVGTGASLLASIIQIIVTGSTDVRPPLANSEDERRKSLFTAIQSQLPYLLYDNLTGYLDSPALAALLTSTSFTDRILGRSAERTLPVMSSVIFTGNNPSFSTELQRRLSLIRLDAKTANPKAREDFVHPDLLDYVSENRGEIIAAILTLIADWVANGQKPPEHAPYIASYKGWREVLGGVLEFAGFTAFQKNRDEIANLAASGDEDPINDLVAAWYDAANDETIPAISTEIIVGGDEGLITISSKYEIDLPVKKNPKPIDAFDYNSRAFGSYLTRYADRYFLMDDGQEVCLQKGPRASSGYKWVLKKKAVE